MVVDIEIIDRPSSYSYTLMGDVNKELLLKNKEVTVRGSFITKTRITTSLQVGNSNHSINFKLDNFKTDEVEVFSYFTGERTYPNYFKKSKKQDVDSYIQYVKGVVTIALTEYLNLDLDKVNVKLILPEF